MPKPDHATLLARETEIADQALADLFDANGTLAVMRIDLALALGLLDEHLPRLRCALTETGGVVWRSDRGSQSVPIGSCWIHRRVAPGPCPIGQAQELLVRYGIRSDA
jgi:hypothetical protein